MATHGKARDLTIAALQSKKAFSRSNFAMKGVAGAVSGTGQLPDYWKTEYAEAVADNDILYTVLSYQTPIAWVLRSGSVITPNVKYSVTTSHHQSLCRVYL